MCGGSTDDDPCVFEQLLSGWGSELDEPLDAVRSGPAPDPAGGVAASGITATTDAAPRLQEASGGAPARETAAEPQNGNGGQPPPAAPSDPLHVALRVQLQMQQQLSQTIATQQELQAQLESHTRYVENLLK